MINWLEFSGTVGKNQFQIDKVQDRYIVVMTTQCGQRLVLVKTDSVDEAKRCCDWLAGACEWV